MCFTIYLFSFMGFITSTSTLKVNLEGTLRLGNEVISSLSEFLRKSNINTRRFMESAADDDAITDLIKTSVLCHDLQFCLPLRKYIDEYVIIMANSIEDIFTDNLEGAFQRVVLEEQLRHYLVVIRYILEETNMKITEDKKTYYWLNTLKTICAKFQEMAVILISEEFKNDFRVNTIKKSLNHKIIITTILIELKYQAKLCIEHAICVKSYGVTKSLHTLLEQMDKISDEKVRSFIRYFYEALFDMSFYSHLNQNTAHELQVTLNDMAYSMDVPTKDILTAVKNIVSLRLNSIQTNNFLTLGHDALLIHVILSDMDHFYSKYKEPFGNFFQYFFDWSISEVRIDKQIGQILKGMEKELLSVPDDLLTKLMNEVKVFLELTVDSPNK